MTIPFRIRLAMFLAVAIVSVVVIATIVTLTITGGPRDGSMEQSNAEKVAALSRLLDGSAERANTAGLTLGPRPDARTVRYDLSARIAARTGAAERPPKMLVLNGARDTRRLAFQLNAEAWVTMLYPSEPPSPVRTLAAYLSLVVLGTTAVALFAAKHLLGPMRMVERALHSVRPDGTLAHVPEQGSAEVRATARALNDLSGRLRVAMESRMRLIAAAGHDLRTPMTRLRLRAEFLADEERTIWLRDLEELDRIADSAIRLVHEEADETAFELHSLDALVAEIVSELGEIGLGVTRRDGHEGLVPMQPLAMKRALRNILENAARHGGGGEVRVTQDDDTMLVTVADRGPGIPSALMGRVFEPFFRVDAARRKSHPGAGLGLAIAREIVERHGGTLLLFNRDGGGLVQELRLPKAPR